MQGKLKVEAKMSSWHLPGWPFNAL